MGIIGRLEGWFRSVTQHVALAGGVILLAIMALTVLDVGGRYLLNRPLVGAFELTEVMMSALVASGLAYCGMRRGHVAVDVFFQKFPGALQRPIVLISNLLVLGLLFLATYQSAVQAREIQSDGTVTGYMAIPLFPFIWVTTLGLALFSAVILLNLLRSVFGTLNGK